MKAKVLGIKAVTKVLQKLKFDPRPPNPISFVVEVQNPSYLVNRAIEELRLSMELGKTTPEICAHVIKAAQILIVFLMRYDHVDDSSN